MGELLLILAGMLVYAAGLVFYLDAIFPRHDVRITPDPLAEG